METRDERMHPVGTEPAWSESYYFNFVDPDSKLAMFTRMGFRPSDRWADGLHVVYLGGDRVAFTYARREISSDLGQYDGDLVVGGLRLDCREPFGHWRVSYDGPAQDIADAAILLERSKSRPDGWYRPARLTMSVDFHGVKPPHYAAHGARGHFEQTGSVTGEITIGGATQRVAGYGVRDKSWGPRDWGAGATGGGRGEPARHEPSASPSPFVNWFSMNFGASLALGGSCFRAADGAMRGAGWIQRDGHTEDLHDVVMESTYASDSILHRTVHLTARAASGKAIDITGTLITVCPTKIPLPGGATFVNEGLAEFRTEGRVGYGISEHWHMVRTGNE
jgi:hypothetical protein